jgi:hypothetical protein
LQFDIAGLHCIHKQEGDKDIVKGCTGKEERQKEKKKKAAAKTVK